MAWKKFMDEYKLKPATGQY